jgi:5-formyltetrahydrofolate cyclo-ligase
MSEQKEQLRAGLKADRLAISKAEMESISQKIFSNFSKFVELGKIDSLHNYIPIPSLNEVNSWPVLTFVWENHPHTMTAVASTRNRGKYMALKINPATKWRGIYPETRVCMPEEFLYDLVIVPTLAFDKQGFRLGWGGGFYDKFLAGQKKALKVGLAPSSAIVTDGIPYEPHDIALDIVITEKGIISQ